jgi:hypothetical protein
MFLISRLSPDRAGPDLRGKKSEVERMRLYSMIFVWPEVEFRVHNSSPHEPGLAANVADSARGGMNGAPA